MTAAPPSFQIEGEFIGFFRDMLGKRRVVLRVEGEEVYLKIPKGLRHEVEGRFKVGELVLVRGTESADPGKEQKDRDRRVVFQIGRPGESTVATCPIRVCAKKNCWRNGGKDLWRELERQIADASLEETVKLKAVDCLDRCKQGPNAEIPGCEFRRCTPRDASEILSRFTGDPQ